MTNKTCSYLAVVISAVALAGCGQDPYAGDSTSTYTGTSTKTDTTTTSTTDTSTTTVPDAGVDAAGPVVAGIEVVVAPPRLLDLVVMIDNSPSMAPKVAKLNAQFSKLIASLQSPADATLPDLRLAIIDSDLGTGCAYSAGSCGPKQAAGVGCFGDQGAFQMLSYPTACTTNLGATFLEVKSGTPVNFSGSLANTFACLAGNVGTMGCGEEHQIESFVFALAAKGVGNEQQQTAFLRPDANLGLIFLTDEDDCSAATNDGMFGDLTGLRGESASLRCATRAHACGGKKLSESGPGYPTTASYTHAFSDCRARTDACPNPVTGGLTTDTSQPTSCSPLADITAMANILTKLKSDPGMVWVAGFFGWPLSDTDLATAQYKIAPVPNPNTADTQHPTVYDYWPICYDPDHLPTNPDPTTGYDVTAAGWGATGGLREAAFVDQFGSNGMKFSICQRDFGDALTSIGWAWGGKRPNLCFPYKLFDADVATPGVQPDCRVVWRMPVVDSIGNLTYQESASIPRCAPGASNGNITEDCWQLVYDSSTCAGNGQQVEMLRTAAELAAKPQLPSGTKVGMQCRVCENTSTDPGCAY
jgi:hypothetical protein